MGPRRQLCLSSPACLLLLILARTFPLPSNQVPIAEAAQSSKKPSQQMQLQQQSASQLQHTSVTNPLSSRQQIEPLSLALQSGSLHPDAPKLIPLSALDRYQEAADLRLFCSASAPASGGRLHFEWRKNGISGSLTDQVMAQQQHQTQALAGDNVGGASETSEHFEQTHPIANSRNKPNKHNPRIHISMMDDSASVLRINHLEADDSGNYTCLARNQHGFDSSTVRISVNVRLKWTKEPSGEVQARAGNSVQLECDASGQPAPLITWTSLKDRQSISSKVLRFDGVQVNDSGLYECKAASRDSHSAGDHLRKLVRLIVNGKYGRVGLNRSSRLVGRIKEPADKVREKN